jgi:hypothetical protein
MERFSFKTGVPSEDEDALEGVLPEEIPEELARLIQGIPEPRRSQALSRAQLELRRQLGPGSAGEALSSASSLLKEGEQEGALSEVTEMLKSVVREKARLRILRSRTEDLARKISQSVAARVAKGASFQTALEAVLEEI